jgi:hypothetical protein
MARGNRARTQELLKESERLEKELWALTQRLLAFTEELQAQARQQVTTGGGEDVPADEH